MQTYLCVSVLACVLSSLSDIYVEGHSGCRGARTKATIRDVAALLSSDLCCLVSFSLHSFDIVFVICFLYCFLCGPLLRKCEATPPKQLGQRGP